MIRLRQHLTTILASALIAGCSAAPATVRIGERRIPPDPIVLPFADRPRNVVLMIADGFGVSHLTALSLLLRNEGGTVLEDLPVLGLVRTSSADRLVTDSAAGASAFATGQRVNNRSLSLSPDGAALPTLAERANDQGWGIGMVTTSYILDATPMAFLAHENDRYDRPAVAAHLLRIEPDLLMGSERHLPNAIRADAVESGYTVASTETEIEAAPEGRLLVLLPDRSGQTDDPDLPLPYLTELALERLASHHDSFFLVVEHEGTDASSHSNDGEALVNALLSFNEAVRVATRFATTHPDTLLVVLADHETGGLQVVEEPRGSMRLKFGRGAHTAAHTPLFAMGPGSRNFAGVHDNDAVGRILTALIEHR